MKLLQGDCLELLKEMPDDSVDSIVTEMTLEMHVTGFVVMCVVAFVVLIVMNDHYDRNGRFHWRK